MNVKQLIEKYENILKKSVPFTVVNIHGVLRDLKQLDEPQRATIPQYIADKIEYCKESDGYDLFHAMDYSYNFKECASWLEFKDNIEIFARAWLDGYEVEGEKRYKVEVKGMNRINGCLANNKKLGTWYFGISGNSNNHRTHHTRKQLEEANFGWVFDCEGIEIEEVEE